MKRTRFDTWTGSMALLAGLVLWNALLPPGRGAPSPGPATNAAPHVQINLKDGTQLRGHLQCDALEFQSEVLGKLAVPLSRIRSLNASNAAALVTLNSGDHMKGTLATTRLPFKFCLGESDVPVDQVARLTVFPPGKWWDLDTGLVARWLADGDAQDATGRHHGELLYGAKFAEGLRGKAFFLDGARSKVSVRDHPDFKPTNSFTIEGWIVLPKHPPHPDGSIIFNRGDIRGGLDSYFVSVQADGQLAFYICDANNNSASVSSPVPKDRWTHVAAVFSVEPGLMQLYINGAPTAKIETKLKPIIELDSNSEPAVGLGNHGGRMHNFPTQCLMDEWGYYSRALEADEIEALYQGGEPEKPRKRPPWQREPGVTDL